MTKEMVGDKWTGGEESRKNIYLYDSYQQKDRIRYCLVRVRGLFAILVSTWRQSRCDAFPSSIDRVETLFLADLADRHCRKGRSLSKQGFKFNYMVQQFGAELLCWARASIKSGRQHAGSPAKDKRKAPPGDRYAYRTLVIQLDGFSPGMITVAGQKQGFKGHFIDLLQRSGYLSISRSDREMLHLVHVIFT